MTQQDTYRNRCEECDAHLLGSDICRFCRRCDDLGITNSRDKAKARLEQRLAADGGEPQ